MNVTEVTGPGRCVLDVVGLAPGGDGLAQYEGRTVFIPFTAPGDRVLADLSRRGGGDGPIHASLVELLAPGRDRLDPPCGHFGPGGEDRSCGGCEWLHVSYQAQLRAKERALGETLRRVGRLEPGSYAQPTILSSPSPLRYRCRAKFHVDRRTGRLVFFRRRSHDAVQLRECHLLDPELDVLRERLGPAMEAVRLPAREVTLEWSESQKRGSAHLKVSAAGSARERAVALLAELPSLSGVTIEVEGVPLALAGDPVLLHERRPGDSTGGVQRSRPDVFQQANRGANALMVGVALDLLQPQGLDVLELFCGAGNFTGPLAARARSVHAVEVQGPALDLARRDLEGAPVRFFAGDSLALARAFSREVGPDGRRFGAVLLDPPREGARGIGPALRDLAPRRVVYVSCDPTTLARDLRGCVDVGFQVEVVQAIDMFPQTHHIEAVALLTWPGPARSPRAAPGG